jgi:hypothetical protein
MWGSLTIESSVVTTDRWEVDDFFEIGGGGTTSA